MNRRALLSVASFLFPSVALAFAFIVFLFAGLATMHMYSIPLPVTSPIASTSSG